MLGDSLTVLDKGKLAIICIIFNSYIIDFDLTRFGVLMEVCHNGSSTKGGGGIFPKCPILDLPLTIQHE